MSPDQGRTWSPPEPTNLVCQILTPVTLDGSRLLAAGTVRTVPEGIRLFAGDDAGRTWDAAGAIQLWDPRELCVTGRLLALGGGDSTDASGLWDALPSFTFGSPELTRVAESELVMTYYAIVGGVTHVRTCRFRIDGPAPTVE